MLMRLQYAFSHHRVSLGAPYRGNFSKSHFYKCVWYLYIRLIPGKQNQINSRTGIQIKKAFFKNIVSFIAHFFLGNLTKASAELQNWVI